MRAAGSVAEEREAAGETEAEAAWERVAAARVAGLVGAEVNVALR